METYCIKLEDVTEDKDSIEALTGFQIRALNVDYYCEEQKDHQTKSLYSIYDIEKALGYKSHGWTWFNNHSITIKAFNTKYAEADSIIEGIRTTFVKTKRPGTVLDVEFAGTFISFLEDEVNFEMQHNIISVESVGQLLDAGKENWVTVNRLMPSTTDDVIEESVSEDVTEESVSKIDAAKEANGNQLGELLNTVHPGNETADAFNNVFDSAKEITNYGELVREGIQLTNEMSEMRVQIADLIQKLKIKELKFNQNQRDVLEMKKSLKNNPLLKLAETSKQEDDSDELKKKLERLETENKALKDENKAQKDENKALKDRIGEGENFKTASMFPNKKQYFVGDDKEVNGKIGLSLSRMASSKGIQINKVRSGAQDVGNYPVWLHQKLEEFIVNKARNEFTFILNPVLKAEYRV